MNKTKAFIKSVLFTALMQSLSGCVTMDIPTSARQSNQAKNQIDEFDKLQAEHPDDAHLAEERTTFNNAYNNFYSHMWYELACPFTCTVTQHDKDVQLNNTTKDLEAMTTSLQIAKNLYTKADVTSGNATDLGHANDITSKRSQPASGQPIEEELAPANNITQEIQFMDQSQQGAIVTLPQAG